LITDLDMKMRFQPSETVSGFLGKGTNGTGELEFAGTLRIDGNFQGSISTDDTLIVGQDAVVHADIRAGEVEIHGQVFGTIVATRRVEIHPTGRHRGDVITPVLSMSPGGMLDGRLNMTTDRPEETTIAAPATAEKKSHTRLERN
jgi:cytoskeletal protein CcmA (bactofilin family)